MAFRISGRAPSTRCASDLRQPALSTGRVRGLARQERGAEPKRLLVPWLNKLRLAKHGDPSIQALPFAQPLPDVLHRPPTANLLDHLTLATPSLGCNAVPVAETSTELRDTAEGKHLG